MRSVLARRHHAIVLAIERNEHVTDRRHGSYSASGWCLISGSLPFHKGELVARIHASAPF
jgi:hypothetical protein